MIRPQRELTAPVVPDRRTYRSWRIRSATEVLEATRDGRAAWLPESRAHPAPAAPIVRVEQRPPALTRSSAAERELAASAQGTSRHATTEFIRDAVEVTPTQSTAAGLAFATTIALLLSGCGSNSTSASSTTATPAASTNATSMGAGKPVSVTEKEFSISLSTTTFTAGTYTFTVKNDGAFPHNLTINGPGVNAAATQTLPEGQTGTLTVTFQKGSYDLFCSVPGHKERGMDLRVQVV